jgi:hypothetical protein
LDHNGDYTCKPQIDSTLDHNGDYTCSPHIDSTLDHNGDYTCTPHIDSTLDHNGDYTCKPQIDSTLDQNGDYTCAPQIDSTLDHNGDSYAENSEETNQSVDVTLEILMTELDPASMQTFWRTANEKSQSKMEEMKLGKVLKNTFKDQRRVYVSFFF